MIKLQNNILSRDPLPAFLKGLQDESLRDLTWTDPALGVSDCAWFLEVEQSPTLNQYEKYDKESLTLDKENNCVIVSRNIIPWTKEEIANQVELARKDAVPQSVSPRQIRQALTAVGLRTQVDFAISSADQDTMDWYNWATTFERAHPKVESLAKVLNITTVQLDELFTLASTL